MRREPGVEGISAAGVLARDEMWSYLDSVVRQRAQAHASQRDSLAVLLEEFGREPEALERVARHLTLLLVGATETFPKVFASGLLRLWQHPEQRRELALHPGLIPTALTEILRYDMPTQWLGRTVVADHEFRGKKFRAGQPVLFLYPSANRDELEFPEPERFDIHRDPPRILSFGHGAHRCLGAFMARMEGRVLLEETLRVAPEYEVLEDEAVRPPTEFVQGYSSFPIAFR
jgi:cytochrome P450